MKKILNPGDVMAGNRTVPVPLFVKVSITDGRLSITGVEGPKANGDAVGSSGQCRDSLSELVRFNPGWDAQNVQLLRQVWERWHLNDMRPGCEHQRAGVAAFPDDPFNGTPWNKRPIDPAKPLHAYGRHAANQTSPTRNMLGWVSTKEHAAGLLCRPCPTCGYKYGTRWLKEDLDPEVPKFLSALPESTVTPPWI